MFNSQTELKPSLSSSLACNRRYASLENGKISGTWELFPTSQNLILLIRNDHGSSPPISRRKSPASSRALSCRGLSRSPHDFYTEEASTDARASSMVKAGIAMWCKNSILLSISGMTIYQSIVRIAHLFVYAGTDRVGTQCDGTQNRSTSSS